MRVYIAGPYSKGDVAENVRAALDAADEVVARGHIPYVPHLTHFWHILRPRPYRWWMAYDNVWLLCCDALLRLPGDSTGADEEVLVAKEHDIPIFWSVDDLPLEASPLR